MESQQLSQHSPISHGSACASVTSKEVQTTQDPLDISASTTEECEKVSTQANSQTANNTSLICCSREPSSCLSSSCSSTIATKWAVPTAAHDEYPTSQYFWLASIRAPILDAVSTLSNVTYVRSTWGTITVYTISTICWNTFEHPVT
ncbi:hypothetical protein FZC28_6780g3310 [Saccharomyces cerevisiae]|nr:hypothetical protein FZC28_6780g3310 [Saccharomyces cerevisiae]KAJ1051677.1 hypothetical protein FZC27_7844g3002 [Saccharomyces cerevisiae]